MASVTKEVKFYDTVVVYAAADGAPSRVRTVKSTWWPKLLKKLEELEDARDRTATIRQRQYYGAVVRPKRPTIDHLQVGRLRDLSEQIEETDLDTGTVTPLILDGNKRVSEPTFVVPFSTSGRIAVMSPGRSTRAEAIAAWLNSVLDSAVKGWSIEFRPVVDESALDRLLHSEGAVGVEFHLDASEELPDDTDVGLLDAVETLRAEGPNTGTLMVGWSLGYDGGTIKDKNLLKALATKIRTDNLARRIKVNMVVQNDDGVLRRETHDLIVDRITKKATWQASPDKRPSTSDILVAISNSMRELANTPNV